MLQQNVQNVFKMIIKLKIINTRKIQRFKAYMNLLIGNRIHLRRGLFTLANLLTSILKNHETPLVSN